jgi:hypothetical protein
MEINLTTSASDRSATWQMKRSRITKRSGAKNVSKAFGFSLADTIPVVNKVTRAFAGKNRFSLMQRAKSLEIRYRKKKKRSKRGGGGVGGFE